VHERLAWVAGRVLVAAEQRPASPDWDAVRAALRADYGQEPAEPPAEDRLAGAADVFGLDAAATALLSVVAAAEFDANLAYAFDLLAGRSGVGAPTVGTALELAGIPTADPAGFAVLNDNSPLLAGRLVSVYGTGVRLYRTVQAPARVAAYLAGDDLPDPGLAAALTDAVPLACEPARQIARSVASGARLTWVHSPLGTAGVAAAAGGLAELEIDALAIDAARAGTPGAARIDLLADAVREAALSGRALIVAHAEALTEPAEFRVLSEAVIPVVAVSRAHWNPGHARIAPVTVEAPVLTARDREQLWELTLGAFPDTTDGHLPVSRLRLTPEEIVTASRYATRLATMRDEPLTQQTVRDSVRALAAGTGSDRSTGSGRPSSGAGLPASFEDLVLPERTIAELHRLVGWAANRDDVIARGPVHGKAGKGTGIAALFTGSPGTGKTMAAHVIADELNLELFQIDLSSIVDKYIGETEKNLERIFHEAESRNVVLFFDEADALFGKRSEVKDARDRYANQEVAYLLQRMEHFDGITIMATNLRGNLDFAFSRRMQFIVHFPDPDVPTRRMLWAKHLASAGAYDEADPVDLDTLAETVDLAGGDIRNVVLGATYDAVAADESVGMRHVRTAAVREFTKLGRIPPASLSVT